MAAFSIFETWSFALHLINKMKTHDNEESLNPQRKKTKTRKQFGKASRTGSRRRKALCPSTTSSLSSTTPLEAGIAPARQSSINTNRIPIFVDINYSFSDESDSGESLISSQKDFHHKMNPNDQVLIDSTDAATITPKKAKHDINETPRKYKNTRKSTIGAKRTLKGGKREGKGGVFRDSTNDKRRSKLGETSDLKAINKHTGGIQKDRVEERKVQIPPSVKLKVQSLNSKRSPPKPVEHKCVPEESNKSFSFLNQANSRTATKIGDHALHDKTPKIQNLNHRASQGLNELQKSISLTAKKRAQRKFREFRREQYFISLKARQDEKENAFKNGTKSKEADTEGKLTSERKNEKDTSQNEFISNCQDGGFDKSNHGIGQMARESRINLRIGSENKKSPVANMSEPSSPIQPMSTDDNNKELHGTKKNQLKEKQGTPSLANSFQNEENAKLKYVLRGPNNRDEKDSRDCPVITKRTMQRALAMEEDDPSVVNKMLRSNDDEDAFTGVIIERQNMVASVDDSDISCDWDSTCDLNFNVSERKVPYSLPPGWKRHFSRSRRKEYYTHPKLGATWEVPNRLDDFSDDMHQGYVRSKNNLSYEKRLLDDCTRKEKDPESDEVLKDKRIVKPSDDDMALSNGPAKSKLETPQNKKSLVRSQNKHGTCYSEISKEFVVNRQVGKFSDRVLNPPDPLCSLQYICDLRLSC